MSLCINVVCSIALVLFSLDAQLSAAGQTQTPPGASVTTGTPTHLEGYTQAALVLTVAPGATANHRVQPPISGSRVGVSVAVGKFVIPALAIEAEFVLEGTTATPQHFSYNWNEDYSGESGDLLLNANVRWRPRRASYVDLVGGGGVAVSRFAERSVVRTDYSPTRTISMLPDVTSSDVQPTVGGGADVRIPLGERVEIGPSLRVRWVRRAGEGFAAYSGVSSYAYQVGAILRFRL